MTNNFINVSDKNKKIIYKKNTKKTFFTLQTSTEILKQFFLIKLISQQVYLLINIKTLNIYCN